MLGQFSNALNFKKITINCTKKQLLHKVVERLINYNYISINSRDIWVL